MNIRVVILACLACAGAACAAPTADESTDSAEGAATAARWEPVYRCDDGSVLDVNTNERREIQFVVRNEAAKRHLMKAYDAQYFDWNISPRGEIVFRGRLERGVFYPQDFTRAVAISGRPKNPTGDQWGPTVEITRQGDQLTLVASEYHNWIFRGCRGPVER